MKLIIDQYSIYDSDLKASNALKITDYSALVGLVNGITGEESGPLPGFLVQSAAGVKEVDLASGASLTNHFIGMIGSDDHFLANQPSNVAGMVLAQPADDSISVIYLPQARITVEAYAIRNDADSADLVYAVNDLVYRSTYGVLTKDSTSATVYGYVAAVNSDGTLDIVSV